MVVRIVECRIRTEHKAELKKRLYKEVIFLTEQPGFVDMLGLLDDSDPGRQVGMSVWDSKADADRYHDAHHSRVVELIRPLLEDEPRVELLNVDTFISHRFAAGKMMAH